MHLVPRCVAPGVLCALVPVVVAAVEPPRALTGTGHLSWHGSGSAGGTLRVTVVAEDLAGQFDHGCGTATNGVVVRFAQDGQPGASARLACERWQVLAGGASYRVPLAKAPGGVTSARWRPGRLHLVVQRAPAVGPAGWLELHVVVAARRLCARLDDLPADLAHRDQVSVPLHACDNPCGDGLVETAAGETCDPGSASSSMCCTSRCEATLDCDWNGDGRRRLLCLGDSNTEHWIPDLLPWCDLARTALPDWEITNAGHFGLHAAGEVPLLPGLLDAVQPDVVVTALGTNDLRSGPPEVPFASLQEIDALVRARCFKGGACVSSVIATVPPNYHDAPGVAEVDALDGLLAAWVRPDRLLDFHSAMPPELFYDGLHLTQQGQQEWAARLVAFLRPR